MEMKITKKNKTLQVKRRVEIINLNKQMHQGELTVSVCPWDLLLMSPWLPGHCGFERGYGELGPESGLGTGESCRRQFTYLASRLLETRYLMSLLKNFSTVWIKDKWDKMLREIPKNTYLSIQFTEWKYPTALTMNKYWISGHVCYLTVIF